MSQTLPMIERVLVVFRDNTMAKKGQNYKQRSTKHTHNKTKYRVTLTPLKPAVNSGASEG